MSDGGIWTLRQRDSVLGSIEITGGDFPWLSGTWSPTAAFAEVKPLFERQLALLEQEHDDNWDDAYRDTWRAGVRLFVPDGRQVPEFLLHIDGSDAWFRWHDEPFDDEGVEDA